MTATFEGEAVLTGPVVLQVPAEPAMARVVRLAASSLAAMTSMDLDDVEDIKIVVSEVMAALIEHGDGPDITIKFELGTDRLSVTGFTDASSFEVASSEMALSATVMAAIAAEHAIQHADGKLLIVATYIAGGVQEAEH
jgi:serine/threonine-protein kinase RsbW